MTARRTCSSRCRRATLALSLAAVVAVPSLSRADDFASGSLIIPASIEYQSNNGMLGAYSLVYAALYLNSQSTTPIPIYRSIAPNKLSTYRCDTMHSDPAVASNLPDYERYNDNDGCDFMVQNAN